MKHLVLLSFLAALTSLPAQAQELGGRLKRIKETATFVVAHGETAIPFSYMDKSGPVGFGPDISRQVAEGLKARLGMKELKIRWNPVTLSTRFPLMVTNTIDIECITTTNTRARQELVSFSNNFYISDEGIATRRDSGIKDYPDLAGKRVAVVRGTTTERSLQGSGMNMSMVAERNNRRAMAALAEGRADAYIAAAPIIAGELVRLADASPFHVVGSGRYKEAFACTLPKGDTEYKKTIDEILAGMMQGGDMERLYNKWFTGPVPPLARKIGIPLDDNNRRLYQAHNDTPFE